jgi:thymidylate synthase
MRGHDVWIGLPYDLFFATVLHELMAGWLGVELGEYHHHVDSLHIYECDVASATEVVAERIQPTVEMPSLATAWTGFDGMLAVVREGGGVECPGWASMAATLFSYRLWKSGQTEAAWQHAQQIAVPLGPALVTWYALLQSRRSGRPQ